MVTKNYSKSRMRENCKYGSVRGGQSNLIPSTRLRRFIGFRGEGIAHGATAWQGSKGSEGSEGSEGKVSPDGDEFYMLPDGSENHTTSLRSMEMHPYPRLRRYFPRRGKFALCPAFELISISRHSAAKTSPSGEGAAAGGRRGAFPRAIGAVGLFSLARQGDYKGFINWRRSRPPQPFEPSAPFESSEPSRPQGRVHKAE